MSATGCDLASLARDGRSYYDDALASVRTDLDYIVYELDAARTAPVSTIDATLASLVLRFQELSNRIGRKASEAGEQFDDSFEQIRKLWHEAVDQRASEAHEDCYSSESVNDAVSEAVSTLKRRIKDAVCREIDDAESY
jgi:hypothetical protein